VVRERERLTPDLGDLVLVVHPYLPTLPHFTHLPDLDGDFSEDLKGSGGHDSMMREGI
jgi:hypothetical protein